MSHVTTTSYADYQITCASHGFLSTPITEAEYNKLVNLGVDDDDVYSIGCDVVAGFDDAVESYANNITK